MATVTTQSIVSRVQTILQDTNGVRWPSDELINWLNDAQREIVLLKPDSFTTSATHPLVTGTKQDIPSLGVSLVDITHNVNSSGNATGSAIRPIQREILDAQRPDWHSTTATTAEVKFYIFDARNPKQFFIYPPNTNAGFVNIVYASSPPTVGITDTISLDDIYANAIADYMLYRAYSKDAEYAANAQRAMTSYGSFAQSLGLKAQAEISSEAPAQRQQQAQR
jgi:hypothetical protein